MQDLAAIDSLRRSEQEAVGFLPMSRYEREVSRGLSTLLLGLENDDPVAFAFWTRGFPVATVQQLVVREDARREQRASEMFAHCSQVAQDQGRYGITLRCRLDLPANEFWRAMGLREIREENSGRRGPLMRYYGELRPALFDLGDYLRLPGFSPGQRIGFRRKVDERT